MLHKVLDRFFRTVSVKKIECDICNLEGEEPLKVRDFKIGAREEQSNMLAVKGVEFVIHRMLCTVYILQRVCWSDIVLNVHT
jgi:hypothetical protein